MPLLSRKQTLWVWFFVLLIWVPIIVLSILLRPKYDTYEQACLDNDYVEAHNLLNDLKKYAEWSRTDAISFKQSNKLVEEKITERHLFGKDETTLDDTNQKKYESLVEEANVDAKKYLVGLNYVYNSELRYVLVSGQDGFKTRAKILIHEMETEMEWFNGTELEEEAKGMVEKSKDVMTELISEEIENQ